MPIKLGLVSHHLIEWLINFSMRLVYPEKSCMNNDCTVRTLWHPIRLGIDSLQILQPEVQKVSALLPAEEECISMAEAAVGMTKELIIIARFQ